MMMVFGKALTAVALLVASITLMVISTTDHHPELARWAILTALFGCTLVVTIVIDTVVHHSIGDALADERERTEKGIRNAIAAERLRTEEIVAGVAAAFAQREADGRLHSVTRPDDV